MSENSSQDRSEQPTEQRLRKARREGQVARSRELQSAALVLVGGMMILASGFLTGFADRLMQLAFGLDRQAAMDTTRMMAYLASATELAISTFLPFFLVLWLVGVLSGMIPGGPLLSFSVLKPQAKRMNPLTGLKRMFSARSLVELGKSLLKVLLLAGIMIWLLWSGTEKILSFARMPLGSAVSSGVGQLAFTVMVMGVALLLIAVVDVPFQRWSMTRKLRMTKQEVKDEQKNTEGRPEIKRKIRELQVQMSRRRIDQRVPEADVVITNPTHYAVAVRYTPDISDAPYVIAKGVDELARRIREVALANDRTVLEIPELARALYHSTRIDQEIPPGLYNAVAHVLMYVVQLSAWKQNRGAKPAPLPKFRIPESLMK